MGLTMKTKREITKELSPRYKRSNKRQKGYIIG
jgi:hypothetical protein